MFSFYKHFQRLLGSLICATVLLAPVAMSGCAASGSYRVYDSDHHDYHQWNQSEEGYYVQWESNTHRHHEKFRKRDSDDQKQYWNWRHSHSDNGHDNH